VTIDQAANQIIAWLRKAVLVVLLISLAVILLKTFGVQLPIRTLGHVELAYLAGAYWLTK
jgi:hypothetical protein